MQIYGSYSQYRPGSNFPDVERLPLTALGFVAGPQRGRQRAGRSSRGNGRAVGRARFVGGLDEQGAFSGNGLRFITPVVLV